LCSSEAFYIQYTWQVTDDFVATLGIGLAWDLNGDGESKLYANYGRYFIPVPTNINVRVAGSELFTQQTCDVVSIDADFVTTIDKCGALAIFGDGIQKGTLEVVNADIDPMYQD